MARARDRARLPARPAVVGLRLRDGGASACFRFAFSELALEQVVAVTDPDNVASQRVLEKIGTTRESMTGYLGSDVVRFAAVAS